jgi:hypothetical protein
MNYILYYEDGEHSFTLGNYTSLEEGTKAFNEQVEEAKKDVETYFGMQPGEFVERTQTDWNEENTPFIELSEWIVDDEDEGEFGDSVLEWVPTHPHDVKENN